MKLMMKAMAASSVIPRLPINKVLLLTIEIDEIMPCCAGIKHNQELLN